jgi:hypothetical protein
MKRQPNSNLGYYVQLRREQRLLRRRKLARIIGFADGKTGAVQIRLLEEQGIVDPPDLLDRIGVVLHLDQATIQKLQEEDRQAAREWLKRIREPIHPYLGLRTTPLWSMASIPYEVAEYGADAIEEFAKDFARSNRLEVHAVFSWRIHFEFDCDGQLVGIREAGRDGWMSDEMER